ncbi:MAG: FtsX-like permease family protein, partial [Treponema sp.]|nr:FtsX-like permease family protein [Treponema sp.]
IVLVASVNISSALVMIVMERRREIAILKSTGGTAEGIAVSFLIVGMGAGAGGVLIGIPLGLLGAVNINGLIKIIEWIINICGKFVYLIGNGDLSGFNTFRLLDPAYYLQDIPVSVSFSDLLLITVGTLLLSLLVSVIPAVKAGREKPLDTLRKV